MVMEEFRCIKFEKRLRTGLLFKVVRSMIWDHGCLVESAAHIEILIQIVEEWMRGFRQRSQDV